ncbi:MAG: hypothetical protein ABMA14_16690 [Hyphomonadaceae bacterium]
MSRKSPEKPIKPPAAADVRARRLAEALRANLKRRKSAAPADSTDTPGKSETADE